MAKLRTPFLASSEPKKTVSEAVTIDEVAREAGMAKGNFYRYFRDKADLVEAVIEPVDPTSPTPAEEVCVKLTQDEEVFIVTGFWLIPSTQADSHGAGQSRPVNSGKLFVLCRRS